MFCPWCRYTSVTAGQTYSMKKYSKLLNSRQTFMNWSALIIIIILIQQLIRDSHCKHGSFKYHIWDLTECNWCCRAKDDSLCKWWVNLNPYLTHKSENSFRNTWVIPKAKKPTKSGLGCSSCKLCFWCERNHTKSVDDVWIGQTVYTCVYSLTFLIRKLQMSWQISMCVLCWHFGNS